jgi:hypothetical protein
MDNARKGPIAEQAIADIKARTDLVELVAETVKLRKTGREFSGRCPFHDDRSPSFSVNPEKQVFNCFGCGANGGVVDYVMRLEGKTFPDAVESLAARLGVPVDRQQARRPAPLARWINARPAITADADGDEPQPLPDNGLTWLQAGQARVSEAADYLASRRIPLELARSLGAGVVDWGGLRLILPHTDPAGRIVSVYGRRIDGGDTFKHRHVKDRPKGFLNAQAVAADELWICEGAFDAMALMAAGISNSVAVFGVNGIRWGWLRQVRRIVLGFDCDAAGLKAIENNAKQCLVRGVEVLAITPDELGGAKDISQAWAEGTLRLTGVAPITCERSTAASPEASRISRLLEQLPHNPPHGLPPHQWAEFKARSSRFLLEHAAALPHWTLRELFAVPNVDMGETGGAIWRGEAIEVTATHVRHRCGQVVTREQLQRDPWLGSCPWPDA